ncbi:hypothetical protein [Meridianimarinicoccus sp. MJW13]|uniref:hypothetical protein n=1 Tax=Meridianimarinicoccus sp. MJW13 TaxID=2720031 RepID=UPI0018682175|nr:hypothetical protein [Fluviibacterium sp. MJW13]
MNILVTGASGNVGREVVCQLQAAGHQVFAGQRQLARTRQDGVTPVQVDFEAGIGPAPGFDAIFLMRPPHLTDPDLFETFLQPHDRKTRVVFLSVQGAGEKSYLPHAKIEKRIAGMGFDHVFLRPSYFMDNLLTTLWPELEKNRRIYLPAGRLELDWISVRDVATVAGAVLTGAVSEPAITICTGRATGFDAVCQTLNRVAGAQVSYQPASLPGFVRYSRKTGMRWPFIGVMLLLHFLPRFGRQRLDDPGPTQAVLGRPPETLEAFVARHENRFATLRQD